jgi:hypothetical protein
MQSADHHLKGRDENAGFEGVNGSTPYEDPESSGHSPMPTVVTGLAWPIQQLNESNLDYRHICGEYDPDPESAEMHAPEVWKYPNSTRSIWHTIPSFSSEGRLGNGRRSAPVHTFLMN